MDVQIPAGSWGTALLVVGAPDIVLILIIGFPGSFSILKKMLTWYENIYVLLKIFRHPKE
jgi:hypothetical protein